MAQKYKSKWTGLQVDTAVGEVAEKVDKSEVGTPNGVAPLDENALVPLTYLPESIRTNLNLENGTGVNSVQTASKKYNGEPSDFSYVPYNFVLATEYEEDVTYYIKKFINSDDYATANPQPTASNFSSKTYYKDAGERIYPDNGDTVPGSEVSGANAEAFGLGNIVNANYGFAAGYKNRIFKPAIEGVAFGYHNEMGASGGFTAGVSNIVGGGNSHIVLGQGNIIDGGCTNDVLIGHENTMTGGAQLSTAIGANNKVRNAYCCLIGKDNISNGTHSYAFGEGLTASANGQVVVGRYNNPWDDAQFIVGSGTGINNKKNAFLVHSDGRATVNGAPTADNDVVRKIDADKKLDKSTTTTTTVYANGTDGKPMNIPYSKSEMANSIAYRGANGTLNVETARHDNEAVPKHQLDSALSTKLDKTGGTIGGDVIIAGDLTINGTQKINNVENLNVKNQMIYTNSDAITEMVGNGGIGIKIDASSVYGITYDKASDSVRLGLGESDKDGAFTFNKDEGNPVAIRDDSSKLTNGHLVKWDSANNKLVDGGALPDTSNFADLTKDNTFTGENNKFNNKIQVSNNSGIYYTEYSLADITRHAGLDTYTFDLPLKSGAIALVSDIPDTNNFVKLDDVNIGTITIVDEEWAIDRLQIDPYSVTIGSDKGNTVYDASSVTLYGQYQLNFPEKDGTFALTSDIPTVSTLGKTGNLSDGTQDATHRLVTDIEKSTWNGKQNALTTTQLAAVNSGITAAKVATYDGYASQIAQKSSFSVEVW